MDLNGDLKKMNKIQVYGMQRSGTNFLEWTLRNNFVGLEYDSSLSAIGNVKGDERFGIQQSLKHTLPNLDNGKALIIYRDYDEWNYSVKKKFPNCIYSVEDWTYYYETPFREKWNQDDYIIVNHRWCVENYYTLLIAIGGRFKVDYKEDWKQPTGRMHYDGGKTMLNIDYNINVKIT
jgi:hypothetical protein